MRQPDRNSCSEADLGSFPRRTSAPPILSRWLFQGFDHFDGDNGGLGAVDSKTNLVTGVEPIEQGWWRNNKTHFHGCHEARNLPMVHDQPAGARGRRNDSAYSLVRFQLF